MTLNFDVTWFGYGVGVVVLGWLTGMLVSMLLGVFRSMGKI